MAASLKLFFVLLFLCISARGMSQSCEPSSIQVHQQHLAAKDGFDSQFEVEIKNMCSCAQWNVRVYAPGFATRRPVDPMVFSKDGDVFLVNGGHAIAAGASVKFSYWWSHYTDISPAVSWTLCN